MSPKWTHRLFGLITAQSKGLVEPGCIIKFITESGTFCIDLATGETAQGLNAQSEMEGSDEVLSKIVNRELSLQVAYKEGTITLRGEPEPFLRLSVVLDGRELAA
jgi:hypothetical protein